MTTTVPLRVAVVTNPTAGSGTGESVAVRLFGALRDAGHSVAELARSEDLSTAIDVDALVVVGGDGTAHLGLNIVAGTGIPLGIIPTGTGNDLARAFGIPLGDTDAAIRTLLDSLARPPRYIDLGRITHSDDTVTYFGGVLAAGFDAVVNERANRMRWPRGSSRYTVALLRELVGLRAIEYTVEFDGEVSVITATLVSIANTPYFGGGMRVAPGAEFDDALFDIVSLEPVGRISLLRIFPKVFAGTHIRDARVTVRKAARVRIDAAAIVAYADGERIGPLPLDVEIVPRGLAVLM